MSLQPGKLLGTKGACIAAIRKLSGASIKLAQDLGEVLDSESSIEGVVKGDRLLTIAGGSGAIMAAASDCAMKLVESQVLRAEAQHLCHDGFAQGRFTTIFSANHRRAVSLCSLPTGSALT